MLRTVLLVTHIGAGVAGLLAGPPAMAAALRDQRRSRAGSVYLAAVTVLSGTAAGLFALKPDALWPFLLLAVATEAALVGARFVAPLAWHVRLACGSYVSLVTALVVVSWGSLLAWALPAVIGTVLVERAAASTRRPGPARTASRSPTPSPRP